MKIYLDYIFLENVIVNFINIMLIYYFTRSKSRKITILFGTIFISIYTTIISILNESILTGTLVKILAVIICIYISFFPKTIIQLIKKVVYYYIFYFMYIGIIISISLTLNINLEIIFNKLIIYIVSALILFITIKFFWKMWKSNIKEADLFYTIRIGKEDITGFVDTGNTAKDTLTNLDVIFLDHVYMEKLKDIINKKNKVILNINTLNEKSNEDGYIIDNVIFYKNNKEYIVNKIIICFATNNLSKKEYSALIGYNTYINNLKGVSFC